MNCHKIYCFIGAVKMINDILIFLHVVETGSFTKAALKLGTTQATVSRRVQELEKDLGMSLINRSTRALEITNIGTELYNKLRDSEQYIKNVINELKDKNGNTSGKLRVSLGNLVALKIITPYLPQFIRDNPGVTLEVYYQNNEADLIRDHFDLAVTFVLPKQQTTLVKKLCTYKTKLYCAPSYIKKYGEPKTVEELTKHLIPGALNINSTISNIEYIRNNLTGEEFTMHDTTRLFANSALHLIEMAVRGEIICWAWNTLVEDELKRHELVPIMPEYSFREVSFYQIRLANIKNPLLDLFSAFIQECFDRRNK